GILSMSQEPGQGSIGRSILCIFVGFVVVVLLSLGTDILLHQIAGFPKLGSLYSEEQFRWATAYRTVYGIAGSYVTAALAPRRPMKCSLIGAAIGLALNIVGAVLAWSHVETMGPHWYPIALGIGALPTAWMGAKILEWQKA